MTAIRSFIAISLTDEARAQLNLLQDRLKEILPPNTVRFTATGNIHLTLHFLGDVAVHDVEAVSRTVRDVALTHAPFALDLSNMGCFPHTRRPRIVWVGLSGETATLAALQRNLGASIKQAIGFEPDRRPYSPHLTIGRVNKGLTKQELAELGSTLEQEIPRVGRLVTLPVDRLHFIRSDLKPNGPVYTSLADATLAQRP